MEIKEATADMAAKLDPSNSELFLKQGLSLFEFGSHDGNEEVSLLLANALKEQQPLILLVLKPAFMGKYSLFLGTAKKNPTLCGHSKEI